MLGRTATRWAILLAIGVAGGDARAAATTSAPAVALHTGWEYAPVAEEWTAAEPPPVPSGGSVAWRPLEELSPRQLTEAGQAWLRLRLPATDFEGPALAFWSNRAALVLYLDGEPFYAFGGRARGARREGWTWHVVPLERGAAGRWLAVWGPHPVPGSVSPRDWQLVPQAQAGSLHSVRMKRTIVRELGPLFLGSVLLVVALGAFGLYLFRGRKGELAPVYFGAFAGIYGIRLLAATDLVALASDAPAFLLSRIVAFCTYLINIPSVLFFEQFFGWGWKSAIRRLWQIQLVYAVAAIGTDLATGGIGVLMFLNAYLVLLMMAVALAHVLWPREQEVPEARIFRSSFLILALFVVNENLEGAGLVPWRLGVEGVGFFLFLCGMAYALGRRVLRTERKLVAVERELETARQIQASILPRRMPEIAGLEVAARYVPVASVAGDFYDFIRVGETRLGVLIADVAGHGVPAALIASMVKAAFSAQARIADDPGRVLTEMNRNLCGSLERRFVTAFYVFLDTARNEATYARGGHPPPLLWRGGAGTLSELDGGGPILGRFADASYASASVPLDAGDRLYLFTDGILEAPGAGGEQFGESRLEAFIGAHRELPPDRFVEELLEQLRRWTSASDRPEREDDLTLVALARR